MGALGQQQVAIAIALQGIEQRIGGLPFLPPLLDVGEQLGGLLALAAGVQRVGVGRAGGNHPKLSAATVGMGDGSFRRRHRGGDLAGLQLGLAEIGGGDRRIEPALGGLIHLQARALGRQRLGEPSLRAQPGGSHAEHPGLVRRRQRGDRRRVGLVEEPGDRREVAADGAELRLA